MGGVCGGGGGGKCMKDIYYIYGVSSGYIQLYSRLDLGSDLVRPRPAASIYITYISKPLVFLVVGLPQDPKGEGDV